MITDLLCFPGNKVECRNNSKTQGQEMSWDPGIQAGVGRNLADKKINWEVLILKALIDLSVCYFNPPALCTAKPPGANIWLVESNMTIHCILNISLFCQKKSIVQLKPIQLILPLMGNWHKTYFCLRMKGKNTACCQIKKFRIQMQAHSQPK